MNRYGYGPAEAAPKQARTEPPVWMAVVGVLVAVFAAAFNLLLSFGMVFATDSCGTSAGSSSALCHTGTWALLVALPWVGLLGGVLVTILLAVSARRRGRSEWLGLAAGFGVYALMCLITIVAIFA